MKDALAKRRIALEWYHLHAPQVNARRRLGAAALRVAREFSSREPRKLAFQQSELRRLGRAANRLLGSQAKRAKSKLKRALLRRFQKSFGRRERSSYVEQLCGISLAGLRRHLEAQWRPGMTWETYGITGWHIDHIRPLASFDLSRREEQEKAFHFSNLQPLWASENGAKGARWNGIDFAQPGGTLA